MLTRRCGMCWRGRWKRTSGWRGWCPAGHRGGRGQRRRAAGTAAPGTGTAQTAVRAAGRAGQGAARAARLLASAPGRGGLGLPRRRALLSAARGAVHAAGRSRHRAAGLAGVRAAGRALPPPVPAGLRVQGARHGDGAIVIPALAGTIGPAAALVTGSQRGLLCGGQQPACHPPELYGRRRENGG